MPEHRSGPAPQGVQRTRAAVSIGSLFQKGKKEHRENGGDVEEESGIPAQEEDSSRAGSKRQKVEEDPVYLRFLGALWQWVSDRDVPTKISGQMLRRSIKKA